MSKPAYKISIEDIKKDLSRLDKYWVVVFGSWVGKDTTIRSDIDIAVISQNKNTDENKKRYFDLLGAASGIYDLKLFELLPLYLQGSIIENYEVVYGNSVDISYYFYRYRKIWTDNKYRIEKYRFKSIEEREEGKQRLKRFQQRLENL